MDTLTFHWLSLQVDATSPPRALHLGVRCRIFLRCSRGDGDAPERAAELSDDAAALAFAYEIIRELTKTGIASTHPGSLVKVRDETRPMVLSIPFLAACA